MSSQAVSSDSLFLAGNETTNISFTEITQRWPVSAFSMPTVSTIFTASILSIGLLLAIRTKAYGRASGFEGSLPLELEQDTLRTQYAHRITNRTPDCVWQGLTWTLFLARYVASTVSNWKNMFVCIFCCLAGQYSSPTQRLLLETLLCAYLVCRIWQKCKQNYQDFLSLGGGGTPQSWNGFKRITLLSMFGKINTLEVPKSDGSSGYLRILDRRPGTRPKVVGIAPQRQLDQRAPQHIYDSLLESLSQISFTYSARVRTATSFLEQHINGIRAKSECIRRPIFRTFGGEIAHPHKIDGSLHCMLHPADIETVINAGWGERHSIARDDWWWMAWFFATEGRPPIPVDLCFLYAPRSKHEVNVIAKIVEAGVKYVTRDALETG